MRAERTPLIPRGLTSNGAYLVWALAAVVTVGVGFGLPSLADRFRLVPLGRELWIVVLVSAFLLPAWWEVWKRLRARKA